MNFNIKLILLMNSVALLICSFIIGESLRENKSLISLLKIPALLEEQNKNIKSEMRGLSKSVNQRMASGVLKIRKRLENINDSIRHMNKLSLRIMGFDEDYYKKGSR